MMHILEGQLMTLKAPEEEFRILCSLGLPGPAVLSYVSKTIHPGADDTAHEPALLKSMMPPWGN